MLLKKSQKSTTLILALLLVSSHLSYGKKKETDSLYYYKQQLKKVDELPLERSLYLFNKAKQFASLEEILYFTRDEAELLSNKGLKELSFLTHKKSIDLAQKNNFKVLEGLTHQDLCLHYYRFNQNKLAYETLLKAKTILENTTPSDLILFNENRDKKVTKGEIMDDIMFNLGTLSMDNEEYDKAEKHFIQSLQFFTNKNDKQGIFYAKFALANVLLETGNNKQSNMSLFELLKDSITLKVDLSLIHYNISWNYLELEKYAKALEHVDKAISISTEIEDYIQLIDLNFLKAKVLKKLKDYKSAKLYLTYALKKSVEIDDLPFLIDVYKELADVEEKDNNPIKANHYFKKLLTIQDTLKKRKEQDSYNEILLKNKLQNQERLNEEQQHMIKSEKERVNFYFWLAILGALLVIAIGLIYYISTKYKNKKIVLVEQNAKIIEVELENKRKDEIRKSQKIQDELKTKKNELLLSLLNIKKRRERVKKIQNEIDRIKDNSIITKTDMSNLKEFIMNKSLEFDKEENIQQKINNTQRDFFISIQKIHPNLTKTDLKILAYLRVNLNTNEIAELQGVSIDAIRKSRHRIRKKLNLSPDESLEKFIFDFL